MANANKTVQFVAAGAMQPKGSSIFRIKAVSPA